MLETFESSISKCMRGISSSPCKPLVSEARKSPKELKLEKALSIYKTAKETGNEERKKNVKTLLKNLRMNFLMNFNLFLRANYFT